MNEQIKITAEYTDTAENLAIFAQSRGWDGESPVGEFVADALNKIVREIISDPVGKVIDSQFEAARLAKRKEEEDKIAARLTIQAEVITE